MSVGKIAACGTYYSDRRAEPCLSCRGGRAQVCRCAGCIKGKHKDVLEPLTTGRPPGVTNNDLFTKRPRREFVP